jgi:predicted amidohydrolase
MRGGPVSGGVGAASPNPPPPACAPRLAHATRARVAAFGLAPPITKPPKPRRGPSRAARPQAWGHSAVVGPFAEVLATCEDAPATVFADLDYDQVRGSIRPRCMHFWGGRWGDFGPWLAVCE